jgi:hypothetical protein
VHVDEKEKHFNQIFIQFMSRQPAISSTAESTESNNGRLSTTLTVRLLFAIDSCFLSFAGTHTAE